QLAASSSAVSNPTPTISTVRTVASTHATGNHTHASLSSLLSQWCQHQVSCLNERRAVRSPPWPRRRCPRRALAWRLRHPPFSVAAPPCPRPAAGLLGGAGPPTEPRY